MKFTMQKLNVNFFRRFADTQKTKAYIMCHIKVDNVRIKTAFSTGITIDADSWDNDRQQIKGKNFDAQNDTLQNIATQIRHLFNAMVLNGVACSAEKLKELFINGIVAEKTLIVFANEWLDSYKVFIGRNIVQDSWRVNSNFVNILKSFVEHIKKPNILLADVDMKFGKDFIAYLITKPVPKPQGKTQIGYGGATVDKIVKFLKRLMREAFENNEIKMNKIMSLSYQQNARSKELVFLETEELEKLLNYKYSSEKLQRTADLFYFQCFVGFRYSDLYSFNIANDTKIIDNKVWINKVSQKIGTCLLPFFSKARKIWEKYNGQLPKLSNGNYNLYIKECAEVVGITKHLTTHTARKTACMMFLESGCDFDTVAEMVGHSNALTTKKHYAKIRSRKIASQISSNLEW